MVFESIDIFKNMFNKCKEMKMFFITYHTQQHEVTHDLCLKSKARFRNNAGCIDGSVIWTHKPTSEEHRQSVVSRNVQWLQGTVITTISREVEGGGAVTAVVASVTVDHGDVFQILCSLFKFCILEVVYC